MCPDVFRTLRDGGVIVAFRLGSGGVRHRNLFAPEPIRHRNPNFPSPFATYDQGTFVAHNRYNALCTGIIFTAL